MYTRDIEHNVDVARLGKVDKLLESELMLWLGTK
jgi:hypothetical protein